MSKAINELAEIVLDRVYKMGWQHRSDIGEHWKAADELVAAERKLGDAERERVRLSVECETLRQERDLARVEIMTWRVSSDSLRKECDHWKQARQDAIEAGELMKAEIEALRQETAGLRQQLDAAQAALTRERLDAEERGQELERLQVFVGKIRNAHGSCELWERSWAEIGRALWKLDAGTTEPAPVAEPVFCPESERLQAFVAKGWGARDNYKWPDELDAGTIQPTPVAEPPDAEGRA